MPMNRRHFLGASLTLLASTRAQPRPIGSRHIALLGDSVFDNAAYVDKGAEVISQLRRRLPAGEGATLLAKDGSRIADLPLQLSRLPRHATDLVISIGGNDALDRAGVLDASSIDGADAFRALADIIETFEEGYRLMLRAALRTRLPLALCTIYHGNFEDRDYQRRASAAVAALDDTIVRCAAERGLTVIDLRRVCAEPADFTHRVEPSAQGSAKIAAAIVRAFDEHNVAARVLR